MISKRKKESLRLYKSKTSMDKKKKTICIVNYTMSIMSNWESSSKHMVIGCNEIYFLYKEIMALFPRT